VVQDQAQARDLLPNQGLETPDLVQEAIKDPLPRVAVVTKDLVAETIRALLLRVVLVTHRDQAVVTAKVPHHPQDQAQDLQALEIHKALLLNPVQETHNHNRVQAIAKAPLLNLDQETLNHQAQATRVLLLRVVLETDLVLAAAMVHQDKETDLHQAKAMALQAAVAMAPQVKETPQDQATRDLLLNQDKVINLDRASHLKVEVGQADLEACRSLPSHLAHYEPYIYSSNTFRS